MKRKQLLLACLTATALLSQPVAACGYHGQMKNPFIMGYPGSVSVAYMTRQALDKQQLKSLLPVHHSFALKRTNAWLEEMTKRLPVVDQAPIHVLVVNSRLWSLISNREGQLELQTHTDGLKEESNAQSVVLISEELLSALVKNRISAEQALSSNLLIVQGDASDTIKQQLKAAFPGGAPI